MMCGPYEHSHWRETTPGTYEIVIDRELNSHYAQKQAIPDLKKEAVFPIYAEGIQPLPATFPRNVLVPSVKDLFKLTPLRKWHRSGVDIVNGEAVTNDDTPLPDEVKTRLQLLFEATFPDRYSIIHFVRENVGKYNDAREWLNAMGFMLDPKIHRTFMYECGQAILRSAACFPRPLPAVVRHRSFLTADVLHAIMEDTAHDALGLHMSTWFRLFQEHPNDYWSGKNRIREKPYPVRERVKVEAQV